MSCNHCLDPVCVYVCQENNFQKRRDGIVVLDPSRCKGCMKCVEACPFSAPKLNPVTNRVDKCNFCVERIDDDLRPVCVKNCITGALGMMTVDTKEIRSNNMKHNEIPLTNYSTPSTQILKRNKKQYFSREG
nr:4Fe-4S dicluster domain-containing protein [Bacillus sp. B15-48]